MIQRASNIVLFCTGANTGRKEKTMSICNGVAGFRGRNPKGIFIHNDAGSQNADAAFYRNWLPTHPLENGFAHAYVASDGILYAEDDAYCAWHCGQTDGNTNYYSIEICQSMGDLEVFKQNEENALKLAAQKCRQYGIEPDTSTIRLHKEVYGTSCPHRSVEIHGGDTATKRHFIERIKYYMGDGRNQIINATIRENSGADFMRLEFEAVDSEDGIYRVRDKANGYLLTAAANKADANVDFRGFDCGEYQEWKLINKIYKNARYTMLECVATPGLYLSVESNGNGGKNNLKLYTDLHNMKQKFYIREESDGRTLIIHAFSGKCVSAK